MSGIHAGVQCRIEDINPKATFVPCESHTLNLAGVHAVGSSKMFGRVSLLQITDGISLLSMYQLL